MMKKISERLFLTGKAMREAQKRYAQNRKYENNRNRLEAERQFDAALAEYTNHKNQQFSLF